MKKALIDCVRINPGYPYRGKIKEQPDGEVQVVQIKDINERNHVNWTDISRSMLTGKKAPNLIESDDILFLARGNKNVAISMEGIAEDVVCSPVFFQLKIRDKTKLIPKFLMWQLNQEQTKRYIAEHCGGTVQRNVTKKALEGLVITIPSMEKQAQVVRLVECYEKELETYNKLISNRSQMMTAVANNIFSGEK